MKVVVISASPRKTANTQVMMQYVMIMLNQKMKILFLSIFQKIKSTILKVPERITVKLLSKLLKI